MQGVVNFNHSRLAKSGSALRVYFMQGDHILYVVRTTYVA